ncbi:hypothetical protein L0Y65_02205 [Candidatus Micrarchaeota archaeon]|nr:hypothetical protein [Candidatus Micrarchaeota archaeon]
MEILVFGLANEDSLLGRLRKRFPSVGFRKCDLAQELEGEGRRPVVIDTLKGLERVTLLDDLGTVNPKRALDGSGIIITLRILMRLGSIDSASVIGVPEGYPEDLAYEEMSAIIAALAGQSA